MIIDTHFQNKDLIYLVIGLLFVVGSIILFLKDRVKLAILFLSFGGCILRFFMIGLDPFIHIWDEQFHALVSKNMMSNPFNPTLYSNPVLPYDTSSWSSNHIWLHKGPVFLWLIAISFKVFGVNEIALRLPSLLMSTILIPIIFRMGKIVANDKVGFMAAFLFATANYQLEMVTGTIGSDHNDVAFMFFLCAGFWAWFEYQNSGKIKWLILIGLFSGLAVDTKWIMGFLVFFCWFLTIILNKEKRGQLISYRPIFVSGLIAIAVSTPWYIYTFIRFPLETEETLSSYSRHFGTVMEGHSGNWLYHIALMGQQYGWIVPIIILPSLYLLFRHLSKKIEYRILIFSWLMTVEIFYAFAQTKMPYFTIIVAPVMYVALGSFIVLVFQYAANKVQRGRVIITSVLILFIGIFNFSINEVEGHHTNAGFMEGERTKYTHNTSVFKDIVNRLPGKDYVIFNCKDCNAIQVMFYSGGTAYNELPQKAICDSLEKKGVNLAVFYDGKLPDYIKNDSKIIKLEYSVM